MFIRAKTWIEKGNVGIERLVLSKSWRWKIINVNFNVLLEILIPVYFSVPIQLFLKKMAFQYQCYFFEFRFVCFYLSKSKFVLAVTFRLYSFDYFNENMSSLEVQYLFSGTGDSFVVKGFLTLFTRPSCVLFWLRCFFVCSFFLLYIISLNFGASVICCVSALFLLLWFMIWRLHVVFYLK